MKRKNSLRIVYWFLLLVVLLFILNVVYQAFLESFASLFIVIILVWVIILPLISTIRHRIVYFVSLSSPILGTCFLLDYFLVKKGEDQTYIFLLSSVFALFFVLSLHILTRRRAFFRNLPMRSMSRTMIATTSLIFVAYAYFSVDPTSFSLEGSAYVYFSISLFAYVATSLLYVNSSYRYYRISDRLKTNNTRWLLEKKWSKISEIYHSQEKDIDTLRFYVTESIEDFIEGNFDRSFIWGYKAIREPTIVNPMLLVSDKRKTKCSFAEIRNTIEHSRRDNEHIEVEKIRHVLRDLFEDNLDLIERQVDLINKLASDGKQ
jgi:hypothetical protein